MTFFKDERWVGGLKTHHIIFLFKDIILVVFIGIVIAEYIIFKRWAEKYGYKSDRDGYAYGFWVSGMSYIPDIVLTIITLVLTLNPLHHATLSFHPIFALVSSIVLFWLYFTTCLTSALLVTSRELPQYTDSSYEKIVQVLSAFAGGLALCYAGMFLVSCVAVHRWRMARKNKAVDATVARMKHSEPRSSKETRV